MKRSTIACVLAALLVTACDSPTAPDPLPEEPAATPEQIETYVPALDDASNRILATGNDRSLMERLGGFMTEIKVGLEERRARRVEAAVEEARALMEQCADDCLIAQERSVIQLTLDYAARMVGLDRGTR
jgi:hypothetical protein